MRLWLTFNTWIIILAVLATPSNSYRMPNMTYVMMSNTCNAASPLYSSTVASHHSRKRALPCIQSLLKMMMTPHSNFEQCTWTERSLDFLTNFVHSTTGHNV